MVFLLYFVAILFIGSVMTHTTFLSTISAHAGLVKHAGLVHDEQEYNIGKQAALWLVVKRRELRPVEHQVLVKGHIRTDGRTELHFLSCVQLCWDATKNIDC